MACQLLAIVSLFLLCGHAAGAKCLPGQSCFPSTDDINQLGSTLDGDLLVPGDGMFEKAIQLQNTRLNGKMVPAIVVFANSTEDVVASINFVREYNLRFSVKSTGHCYNGNCMQSDSFHLDLSRMRSLTFDDAAGTARAGPGVTFEVLYAAADDHGFLAVGGMGNTVGLVGYSSGGGHGPLIRSFGLGADQLLALKMVLANGTVTVVSARSSPELFWAIRGGGGGTWGIVVEVQIQLHRAPLNTFSLECYYPIQAKDPLGRTPPTAVGEPVLEHWVAEVMTELPDEWAVFFMATKAPLAPTALKHFNPLTMDGVLGFNGVYVGNGSFTEASKAVEPLTNFSTQHQLACSVQQVKSFNEWHKGLEWMDPSTGNFRDYMESAFVRIEGLRGDSTRRLATIVSNSTLSLGGASMNAWFGVHLGGRIRAYNDSAVSSHFRQADLLLEPSANWFQKLHDPDQIAWVRESSSQIQSLTGVNGQYLNEADPDTHDFASMYWDPKQYSLLQSIKSEVDPANMFDCWQCVKPKGFVEGCGWKCSCSEPGACSSSRYPQCTVSCTCPNGC